MQKHLHSYKPKAVYTRHRNILIAHCVQLKNKFLQSKTPFQNILHRVPFTMRLAVKSVIHPGCVDGGAMTQFSVVTQHMAEDSCEAKKRHLPT